MNLVVKKTNNKYLRDSSVFNLFIQSVKDNYSIIKTFRNLIDYNDIIINATKQINIDELEKLLYLANVFEVEWLKFISERYHLLFNKDTERIKMIEERLRNNNINK